MWLNLSAIFRRLSHDPNVRAIVLTSAGDRAFTSGLDVQGPNPFPISPLPYPLAPLPSHAILSVLYSPIPAASQGALSPSTLDPARKANSLRRHILEFQDCISEVEKCEKPVIAIMHGISFGLAIDLSLACDIRLSTSTTKFCVKEVDIGLAADVGTLSRLPHAVGNQSWVKEICLSAKVFGAEEAARNGLISNVYSDKQAALAEGLKLAGVIASKSPVAVMGTKELLNYSRGRPVEDGLRYTSVWNGAMVQSQDVKDAVLSGLQKRVPKFSKL